MFSKIRLFLVMLVMNGLLCSVPLAFVSQSFDDFTIQFVAPADRQDFSGFFASQMEAIQSYRKIEKRQKALQAFKDKAQSALAVRRPLWAQELKPYVALQKKETHRQRVLVNNFLLYYGAHETFLYNKLTSRASLWAKVKNSVQEARSRVTTWVGSLRQEKTIEHS